MKIVKRILAALAAVALIAALIAVSASASTVRAFNDRSSIEYAVILKPGESVIIAHGDVYEIIVGWDTEEGDYPISENDVDLAIDGLEIGSDFSYADCFTVNAGTFSRYGYFTLKATGYGCDYLYVLVNGKKKAIVVFVADTAPSDFTLGAICGYDRGNDDGKIFGYTKGYAEGNDAGYNFGLVEGYNEGFEAGKAITYKDVYDNGFSDGYGIGKADGYSAGLTNSEAYKSGYDAGFNSVIQSSDGAAVSGFFSGVFGAFYDGYQTIANGITLNGISVGTVVSTLIVICVVVVGVRLAFKWLK